MAEKIFVNKKGSCICGAINFTVKLDEIPRVFNCHCQDCRKKIGGMISIIELRENAIDIEMSKLSIYEHNGGSEKKIKSIFVKNVLPLYSLMWKNGINIIYMLDCSMILLF